MKELYMKVEDLNEDELYQLKEDLFYREELDEIFDDETLNILKQLDACRTPDEIPNELVYKIFDGVDFVKNDFWCNRGEDNE